MEYIINNDYLEVKISEGGAEIQSIKSKLSPNEYLWQGDPVIWNRRAPILFPIVGRLLGNSYKYQGNSFELSQHGFARDKQFAMAACGDQEVLLFLTEDDESLVNYPFKFVLFVNYSLEGSSLLVTYEVKNTDENEMYFSIGGHPGFNCPWEAGFEFEDYYLELELNEQPNNWLLEGPYQSGKYELAPFKDGKIFLTKSLFDNDALIFKNLQSKSISLVNAKNGHYIKMDFHNFPYFGLWSKKSCDKFICLEPWAGVADALNASGDLREKEGIIKLTSGESYRCSYRISVG